jgi:hypothetical protein
LLLTLLKVRALFDRLALEETLARRGEAAVETNHADRMLRSGDRSGDRMIRSGDRSGDRMLRSAGRFIRTIVDENGDGKLGKEQLDLFFREFHATESKQISWPTFEEHGLRLLESMREREEEREAAKEIVPSRDELKISSSELLQLHARRRRPSDRVRHGASFGPSASGSQPRERPRTRRTEHSVTRLELTRSAPTLPAAARDAPTTPAPPLRAVPASSMAARRPSQVALTVPVPVPMQAPMEATSGSRAALSRAHIA